MEATSLSISALSEVYRERKATPADVLKAVYSRIQARGDDHVWIHRVQIETALEKAAKLARPDLPLFGIPFAVKDNIDVAGLPTTAACPAFAHIAERSATVVERLESAGAILIGKTNMDQFATGLTGTRSPYGIPRNPFNERYIPGGSSSGSAVAVAVGLVSFALGTDTAGSGRVPAAFNNIVGLKPTRGFFSTRGVVPACRTLDCVSVFAVTTEDAGTVAKVLAAYDPEDSYSRAESAAESFKVSDVHAFRFGVPDRSALEFFGNTEYAALFEATAAQMKTLGGDEVPIDFGPLKQAACLLYQGPWVAERLAPLKQFIRDYGAEMHPVTRTIIEGANRYSAVDVFEAMYKLADLKRGVEPMWGKIDVLLLPTTGTIYDIEAVLADPVQKNSDLGYYTNFVNLLEMCAIAVPCGFTSIGLPFGVTLAAPPGRDGVVLSIAARLKRDIQLPMNRR